MLEDPAGEARLSAARGRHGLERVAGALHAAGYFGPFGIDAYRYADAHGRTRWNPCGELNARYTMGYALGMADRPATE